MGRAKFDAEHLIRQAEHDTGLSDWGGEPLHESLFRQLFAAMVNSLNEEADLNARGHAGAAMRLPELLTSRLRLIEDRKRWPAIADERIENPIMILGLPRSGTTFLQSLLAQDPDNRVTRIWEMMCPSPPPETGTYDDDPRITRVQEILDAMGLSEPEVYDLHPTSARLPEECHYIEEMLALGDNLRTMWHMPSYTKLRAAVDETIPYAFDKLVLQHLQFRHPGKRWVLKGPAYLLRLPELFAVHPDARIVQLHRDPVRIIPSVAGFVIALRQLGTDKPSPKAKIAMGNLKAFAHALTTVIEYRRNDPNSERYLDLHFKQLIADPIGAARSIYRHFDLELSDSAVDAMRAWLDTPESRGATARHRLADYDLDEATINAHFGDYIAHFAIERESDAG